MKPLLSENIEISSIVFNPEIKILIVDDRDENLLAIEVALQGQGYIFTRAHSGQEAFRVLLKEFDFTLILLDVNMPGLNGFETAGLIYEREKLRHIPVIFITATEYSQEYIYKAYKAGAADYINKPINPELLRAKVSVFVDLYKKNHRLMAQEQRLQLINNELETRVKERTEELLIKNDQLEVMNLKLKKINDDQDNFVYSASHDLKAPLTNIEALFTTLVESINKYCSEEDKTLIGMMNKSITLFKDTIKDLSEVTKIEEYIEGNEDNLNFGDIIEDVMLSMSENISTSEADIKIDVKECQHIKFSKKNLKSIIYNLLSNAVKYRSPERKAEIWIGTQTKKEYIVLTVKDNGLGMDLKKDGEIFSLFKRLHTHVEGSGIGLYIVMKIIVNAGGKIEVESEVGNGSVFKVYFKL